MSMLKFSNRNGFPLIESTAVNSDGTTTTISFNPRFERFFFGGFWVKIGQPLATGTDVVLFTTTGVNNSTVPVYLNTGVQSTAADFVSTGESIHLCFYDRDTNRVQLIA